MNSPLRRCLTLGLVISTAGIAQAQIYPGKAIRLVVPYAVGGGTDIVGRLVAARLGERLGQQVVVDNRPGAGAIIGSEIVARAAPDGYTLLFANIAHGSNPALHRKLPYDAIKDFTPVTLMALLPSVLAVHPSIPARNVKEFVALAKARPGTLSYGTAGNGSANHLTMAVFAVATGTNLVHVPYKGGGPAIAALIQGEIASIFVTIPPAQPHVKSGRVRALGLSARNRHASLPDVPTVAESGLPGFEVYEWHGIMLPAGAPPEVVVKLGNEIRAVLSIADVRTRIAELGADVVGSPAEGLAEHVRKELATWSRVVKQAGIQAD